MSNFVMRRAHSKYRRPFLMFATSVSFLVLALSALWPSTHSGYSLYFGDNLDLSSAKDPSSFMDGGLAATEKGNVYVVWVDGNAVYFRSSQDNGTRFGNAVLLSNKVASSPKIAATEKGNVYVVWVDGNAVYFRSSQDNGTRFGNPVLLSDDKRIASSPQIASTEKGNVYVVWSDKNSASGDSDIILKISRDGGKEFGKADRISRNNDVLSYTPQITATEIGNVYVVRADMSNNSVDNGIIFKRSTNNGGEFDRNVHLNRERDDATTSFSPEMAATEDGDVYVVWSESDIQFKEILDYGTWLSETVSINNRTTRGFSPHVAATEKGDVYLLWVDQINATNSKDLLFKRISHSIL